MTYFGRTATASTGYFVRYRWFHRIACIVWLTACAGWASVAEVSAADGLKGAESVLREVAEAARNTNATPATVAGSEYSLWKSEAQEFSRTGASLDPESAVRGWLSLFDRLAKLEIEPQERFGGYGRPNSTQRVLIEALPSPAAWPVLARAIHDRPVPDSLKDRQGFGLRMLGAALTGNLAELTRQVRDFEALLLKADPREARGLLQAFEYLGGGSYAVAAHVQRIPIATTAASALFRVGRTDEARRITHDLLEQTPEDDRVYEILLGINGDDVLSRLDRVFAEDPFQERPLIWKSQYLFKSGRLEEAEKVARQAIAIDPSDGEQGKGDRMRIYSVLADIREARGDAKEAGILRGAVRAIRLSERADDFFATGLLTRAVALYQESLPLFTDAYCIQSRLAVQLDPDYQCVGSPSGDRSRIPVAFEGTR